MESNWISVKDRLPENLSEVIISDINTGEVISGMIFINGKFQDANEANRVLYFPTHWMPLPEPPKQ
jgi:hypothetical protein